MYVDEEKVCEFNRVLIPILGVLVTNNPDLEVICRAGTPDPGKASLTCSRGNGERGL